MVNGSTLPSKRTKDILQSYILQNFHLFSNEPPKQFEDSAIFYATPLKGLGLTSIDFIDLCLSVEDYFGLTEDLHQKVILAHKKDAEKSIEDLTFNQLLTVLEPLLQERNRRNA